MGFQELRELVLCYLRVRDLLRKWKSCSQLCLLGAVREAPSAEGFPKKVKIKGLHRLNEVLNTWAVLAGGEGKAKRPKGAEGQGWKPWEPQHPALGESALFPSSSFRRNIPKKQQGQTRKGRNLPPAPTTGIFRNTCRPSMGCSLAAWLINSYFF